MACERVVFAGPVASVYARSHEGWFGILPGHAPAVFALAEAPLRVTTADGTRLFHVQGGTLYVDGHTVTVLSERATSVP